MNKIIVHGGTAHLDDMMSCAILLAYDAIWSENSATINDVAPFWEIERRNPTEREMEGNDPGLWIIDVGEDYSAERGHYDHHQLHRGSKDCAMTLLASNLGLPNGARIAEYEPAKPGEEMEFPVDSMAELLDHLFPWFRVRAEVDSCGRFAAAKSRGTEWNAVKGFLGPFENIVLAQFEREPMKTVVPLAEMILRKINAFDRVQSVVKTDRPWWGDGDFAIVDFTKADPKETEEVSDALTPAKGVAIFHDNRGEGLTLLRLGDDPRIDFTKVKDDPKVSFAHMGGFIAKSRSKSLDEAWRLIEDAYTGR